MELLQSAVTTDILQQLKEKNAVISELLLRASQKDAYFMETIQIMKNEHKKDLEQKHKEMHRLKENYKKDLEAKDKALQVLQEQHKHDLTEKDRILQNIRAEYEVRDQRLPPDIRQLQQTIQNCNVHLTNALLQNTALSQQNNQLQVTVREQAKLMQMCECGLAWQ